MALLAGVVALFVLVIWPANAESHHAGELTLEPYSFETFDGASHPAELGRLWVPENRSRKSDRLIQLALVRLKSSAAKPRSPVVFLAGGPGIPATTLGRVPVYYQLFEKVLAFADVILADQRGIGMSSPNTQCPEGPPAPADALQSESRFREALVARARACAGYWRGRGLDLASYSSAESVDDLEDLRTALGAGKLSLLGHSYGATLALVAVKSHAEHLDRVVLAAGSAPDQSPHLPLVSDFALRRLSGQAATAAELHGAFPDTYGDFRRAVAQLDRDPLTVLVHAGPNKPPVEIRAGAFPVQFVVNEMLANGRKVERIPALVASLTHRDTSLLSSNVEDLYELLSSGFSAMQFAIPCADGWPAGRRQLALQQATQSVFGGAPFVHLDPRLCKAVGVASPPGDTLLQSWSSVPALLVSGTLDSNSPAFQSGEILWGLGNGVSLTVENGFHETLPAPEVQAVVTEFLGGANIRSSTVRFAPPAFLTVEEARQTPQVAH